MILSISQDELLQYVKAQCDHFFPDKYKLSGNDVKRAYILALERLENCMSVISHPGYHDDKGNTTFSHLHGDQYASFLYFFGNSLWLCSENKPLCDKLMLLNRALFDIFISYKCGLPEHFFLGHAFGTIIGNAVYNDFLVVSQGVTINTSSDDQGNPAPVLGKGLFLGAHAKIIGNKPIGDRVSIGVDAFVYQQTIPDDSVVINETCGKQCKVIKRKKEKCTAQNYFSVEI